ncbi:MAG: Fur family transcriptional regulator [Candidatus Limnocylindria bacterium]
MPISTLPEPWQSVIGELRRRGLRWTPSRRLVLEVLSEETGHVTGAEIVDRCRQRDRGTVPSTVYRTLDVLEELGLVRHAHGADGQEEYHVRPTSEHGHLHCEGCGGHWELGTGEVAEFVAHIERHRGFTVDLSHLTLVGRCPDCSG